MTAAAEQTAPVGVVGGSGLYDLLDDAREVSVTTPYGPPSDVLTVGLVGGREVVFVPRHGRGHRFPPHRVNYRANLWALRSLGVRQVLAPSAVGSLRADLPAGTVVLPDQVVDRTWGRAHTFSDTDDGVVHVGFADPYCPVLRSGVQQGAAAVGEDVVPSGTLVVVNGPRFSSRAESRWHAALGGSVVGMTGMPEASLARELGLCYACIALVTDLDAGVEGDAGVTHQEVLAVMAGNVARVRVLLAATVPVLPAQQQGCGCAAALEGQHVPYDLP
ncbi:5'-methylthioadenosine phosphorylase [Motilibacter rhizosphaerae]|uniref:Purine nucleoside phosphorylase n=1 Tax=Motilibacter rhizosphaerae TaxID=598652 RepID=A0A4Q7NS34_9ACTN|nr:S-methyl-5'-thioadenosine phosphorylase [Motilibacter rhizosphaerae]RZS89744.1 5'-methylthioadenosine phosphorylase [Motilibacter rhizosphaerae]